VVKPFLQAQGFGALPHLVLTHGDQHHIGGFQLVNKEFRPRFIYTSPARSRSPAYREARKWLEAQPARARTSSAGDRVGDWEVLHPAAGDKFERADDNALVLRLRLPGLRVLLLSELGSAGQRALVARGGDLQADVVIAGIPEHGEPLEAQLLAAVQPRLVLLTDAEFPVTKRAKPVLRNRLSAAGTTSLSLREAGTLCISATADRASIRSVDGQLWAELPAKLTAR
jgi:competence protein ComEC